MLEASQLLADDHHSMACKIVKTIAVPASDYTADTDVQRVADEKQICKEQMPYSSREHQ